MNRPDRRAAPRIEAKLPLRLADGAGPFATKTRNLSVSGAYCTIQRFIALMTKLQVRLELPGNRAPMFVDCRGVVVRIQPPRAQPRLKRYHIAIFFQDLTDSNRAALAQYVQRHLRISAPMLREP